ncbi:hypothetical protein ACJJIW_05960 [Microbulbifer sp. JMSA004]|uniref:hypothetical protein n=1 Tax=unclassified Microbulbifer TaxID=2619833 RepID=UPI0024ADA893|nr:hypothetical protein [Microbulbifer sp. VAAF005]WHI44777.1 hypothetical protein P0078_13590 [Microbulbifer sp. VAAF005]WNZ56465.1 hypothetical protein QT397_03620 [Microbulbifer sp. MKSA007]
MKFLRLLPKRHFIKPVVPFVTAIFLAIPMWASAESAQQKWAGNWLVVSEGDDQLVWQLHADGSGYAYGFNAKGLLTHGFAINWQLDGDRVRVKTGTSVRCKGGVVSVAFRDWSRATLLFAVIDGRHWLQAGGGLLSFQRRLADWRTPKAGASCPDIVSR